MPKSALIAGSTGLVGSNCLQFLLASPEYASVGALVRRPVPISYSKLQDFVVDFEKLADVPPAQDVFCALGTTMKKAGSQAAFRRVDLEYPLRLAGRSLAAGAQQFLLVSSAGADPNSRNFYLRTKGELEQALRSLPFTALHIFRPSLLVGDRKENRLTERFGVLLAPAMKLAMIGRLRKYRPIEAELVAKAMVNAALDGGSGIHVYEYDRIVQMAGGTLK